MAFACVHIPEFSVQAVMRFEPALGGPARHGGQALALLDGTPPQCRVVAANEAALRAGIEIGMAKAQALLVGQAPQFGSVVEIRRRSPEQEKNTHAALRDLGASFSPRVEDTAPEAILLDLAGLEALFGSDETLARRLVERVQDLGLEAQVAVASNPDTALHAARGQSQITVIPEGEEAVRLGPLPISVLGPSPEALETLHRWGVRTCAALAALPVLDLSERLSGEGVRLHEWARGAAQRSLVLAEAPLSFEEELTLDYEVTELEPLSFLLSRMIEALCARLEARSLAVAAMRLRLKLTGGSGRRSANHQTGEIPHPPKSGRSRNGTEHQLGESSWFVKVLSLPVPMRNAKLLLNLLRLQLQNDPPGAPVCGVFLAAEPARPRATQGGFFVPTGPDPEKLELTLARLAHLVGEARVGSPEIVDTHRPDTVRMRRFAPGPEEKPTIAMHTKQQSEKPQVSHKTGRPELQQTSNAREMNLAAFRDFRPAVPARVEMRARRPAKVFFRGLCGEVVAASGPWCASGDWWTKDSWQHEEWDLEIVFANKVKPRRLEAGEKQIPPSSGRQTGLYRFAYDPVRDVWVVRGMFD